MENVGDTLRRRAWISPDVEAMVDLASGERLSYPELNARANQVAHALTEIGIGHGDKVALLCLNSVEFVEVYYAAAKIGAVVVPLNWRLTAPELEFILGNSESRALVFGAEFAPLVDAIHADAAKVPMLTQYIEVGGNDARSWATDYGDLRRRGDTADPKVTAGGDDLLTIVYTSGTTGLPKGVMHTHQTALAGIVNGLATLNFDPKERYLQALPMFHVGASTPTLMQIFAGNTVFMMRQFDPAQVWEVFETEKITAALAVPAMLNFMLQVQDFRARDISALRGIISGASPVPIELINAYLDLGIEIHQVYGMTETFGPGCYLPGHMAAERLGSTGRGYLMTDVRIVDDEGRDVPAGEPGQIIIKAAHNMTGYWKNDKATAETLVDGWLQTGDIGIADADGYVTIRDRLKDMIISGGENVYPAEVENALLSHGDVLDAAVIGQPSAKWGESPFAVVVPSSADADKEDILDHCAGRLAKFKLPKGIAFIDEIPRNPTGKPLKRVLREQFPGPAPE